MVKFINKRVCGSETEGFGEHATVWKSYEYQCPECGKWDRHCDVSQQIGDDPNTHGFLCRACAEYVIANGVES